MRAEDLFPELFAKPPTSPTPAVKAGQQTVRVERRRSRGDSGIGRMPQPPDVSWLAGGLKRKADDDDTTRRQGLVMVSEERQRNQIISALSILGFTATVTADVGVCVAAVQNLTCCLVIADINEAMPSFHRRMLLLPMPIRRMIFYVLIGPQLRTTYGLEAISLSANLVVNDRDLAHLEKILRKGFRDYELLYRPLLEEIRSGFPPFMG